MPAAVAFTISDGAATPVAHTFTPIGKDAKGVLWFEQTTPAPTSPLEAKRIGYRQSRAFENGKQNGQSKIVITLALPKLEVLGNSSTGITPPPTLAYRNVARIEVDMPERGVEQERKDLRVLAAAILGTTLVGVNCFDKLQPLY
jgi:hypothetical protein